MPENVKFQNQYRNLTILFVSMLLYASLLASQNKKGKKKDIDKTGNIDIIDDHEQYISRKK